MADETVLGAQGQPDGDAAGSGDTGAAGSDGTQDQSTVLTGADAGTADTGQTAGAKTGDGDQGDAGVKSDGTGAPETYADFTAPEGVTLDAKVLEQFVPLAKELGLSQENAQKLVDLQTGMVQAEATARETAFTATLDGWRNTNKADVEFGGPKWDATKEAVGRLVNRFGTPELSSFLNETGVGDHPELVRFVSRLAGAIAEDTVVNAEGAPAAELTRAQRMYGTDPK